MTQVVIAHSGWSFWPLFFFSCGRYSCKYLKYIFNNTRWWHPTTDRKVSVETHKSFLCQRCFQVHTMMADGVCLAKWLGLQHDTLRDLFCPFCRLSQRAPLGWLKRQDIYASFTNFWSLVSTDGGNKWKTKQPPHAIKWVSGLGRCTRTRRAPSRPTVCTGSSGSALPGGAVEMAGPGFRGFCWLCWSLAEGKLLFFQK